MRRWLFGWWFYTEAVVMRLTIPRTDAGACDADVDEAIRDSRLSSVARAAVATLERAWAASYVRPVLDSMKRRVAVGSRADGIRQAGICVAVAAVTVLLLQTAESEPGPLRWVLPLAVCAIAGPVAAAADPIARAWEAKRRR
jgi:hypothetical protein